MLSVFIVKDRSYLKNLSELTSKNILQSSFPFLTNLGGGKEDCSLTGSSLFLSLLRWDMDKGTAQTPRLFSCLPSRITLKVDNKTLIFTS